LTRKDITWNWLDNCKYAFNDLKKTFTIVPILAHWNPESQIILETNASDPAIAAILSTYKGNKLYPIAFYSRSF